MKAIWKDQVIAESNETIVIEGNHYFPPAAVRKEFFRENPAHTYCPWKGEASYYDVVINGEVNEGAAWYYAEPKEAARQIQNYVAFWRGVQVTE